MRGAGGEAVYLPRPVYGGPGDGRYSDRIVFTVNDRERDIAADGAFEFLMGRKRPDGYDGPFLETADDAVAAITRDYMNDPGDGRRVEWHGGLMWVEGCPGTGSTFGCCLPAHPPRRSAPGALLGPGRIA